ncbi:cytochrome c oxidase subunit II [Prochlorococcus sp. MIT 1307]|uniref:cytochrome c oxidase subunit II n=1 Tax=Prochlorococcus sp. MIT 1307 TaxID=3096219 RepID=UPI0039BF6032
MESLVPKKSAILIIVLVIALLLGGIWVGQNVNLLPVDASTNASVYDELFKVLFSIGTILFVGMVGLVIYSLIRFRRKPGELGDGIPIEENLPLEIFWTAIPTIIILFVGLYSYDIYDRMGGMQTMQHGVNEEQSMIKDERIWGGIGAGSIETSLKSSNGVLPVEVTALQFAFLFHYPKGDIISGELHVPVGKQVSMRLESKDVIHAFWVPEFRIKQDVIPGQPTILNFTPTKPGRYPIICAELCGPYHGGMRSTVVVEEPSTYQEWFNNNSKESISNL